MTKTILVKTKKDLVERVANDVELSKKDAEAAVNAIFEEITDTLKDGGELSISGFGKFEVKTRAARTGINPATKETIQIPETKVPGFKAGKALKEIVKG